MKRAALFGFLIWLAATVSLRIAGQYVLALHPLILLGASAPLMVLLTRLIVRQPLEGIALAAPGMLLDAFSAIWFAQVFPNIPPAAAGLFGGWLLFCNVVALVTAAFANSSVLPYTRPRLSREP